jgi:molybdopterin-binding aldehyde dehydrogenase-like protein
MSEELARRDFLKTTGVVVVGFSIADKVAAQAPGDGASGIRRGLVSGPPDPGQVDSYIAIHPDNTATLYAGYVELGQGGPTALRQIAAEELDLDLDQVKTVTVDTFVSTNGFTAASRTAAIGGTETRAAAAEARRALLEMASERLKTPVRDLTITRGVVSVRNNPQRSVTFADLVSGKSFNRKFEQVAYNGGIELPRKSADNAIPKRRECRDLTSLTKSAGRFSTCSTSAFLGCFTVAWCGLVDRARLASAIQPRSASMRHRLETSLAFRSFDVATSSVWLHNASGTPSAQPGS